MIQFFWTISNKKGRCILKQKKPTNIICALQIKKKRYYILSLYIQNLKYQFMTHNIRIIKNHLRITSEKYDTISKKLAIWLFLEVDKWSVIHTKELKWLEDGLIVLWLGFSLAVPIARMADF